MYYAVVRTFDDGELIMPPQSEGITIEDFVILAEDVMTVPSDKIKDVTVEKTFFRGNRIYEKGDSK